MYAFCPNRRPPSHSSPATCTSQVQIAGPALALFFAALGSTGTPPSIAAPDSSFTLNDTNVPPSFRSFFTLWQSTVPLVQHLGAEARHDLALLLCDKDPTSSPLRADVVKLAGDLKAVAIEITQRRTFQLRYAADLEHALNSAVRPRRSGEEPRSAGYVPPPEYEGGGAVEKPLATAGGGRRTEQTSPGRGREEASTSTSIEEGENVAVIRETLYSALADCIVETPSILTLLSRGPQWASRAFFASTALAILDGELLPLLPRFDSRAALTFLLLPQVALTRVDRTGVRVVHMGRSTPRVISPHETPAYLRPFLGKLLEVSDAAKAMAEEDDERAMREAAEGDVTSEPRMERLRERLEKGAGEGDAGGRAASVDGSVASLANAIGELAIGEYFLSVP